MFSTGTKLSRGSSPPEGYSRLTTQAALSLLARGFEVGLLPLPILLRSSLQFVGSSGMVCLQACLRPLPFPSGAVPVNQPWRPGLRSAVYDTPESAWRSAGSSLGTSVDSFQSRSSPLVWLLWWWNLSRSPWSSFLSICCKSPRILWTVNNFEKPLSLLL